MVSAVKGGLAFGPFTLSRRIGAGGMAEVFLARRTGVHGFEKELVVKRILPHLCESQPFIDAFLNEARLAALLNHPNLAQVFDFGQIEGRFYLAMEYVDGVTLADFSNVVGALPPGVACRITLDVLDALDAFHRARDLEGRRLHLVHRDVTPKNVMITRSGTVKLLDFGIAISVSASAADQAGRAGTRRYMAPEQRRAEPLDQRADLYCAALMMVELVTGSLELPEPVLGRRPPPARFPADLWSLIAPALEDMPDRRPESARALLSSLEGWALVAGEESTRPSLRYLTERFLPSQTQAADVGFLVAFPQPTLLVDSPRPARTFRALPLTAIAILALTSIGAYAFSERPRQGAVLPAAPPKPKDVEGTAAVEVPARAAVPREIETRRPRRVKKAMRRPRPPPAPRPAEASGYLSINTRPWTRVWIDGRRVGDTPLERIEVRAGVHQIRLENPDAKRSEQFEVRVEPDRVARIRRTLPW